MNDYLLIGSGAGLQDGLNPGIFMTCAVFMASSLWFKKRSLPAGWLSVVFVFSYMFNVLNFSFGIGQMFILSKSFIIAAKIIYFILGLGAFVAGILFFKDWILLRRGLPVPVLSDEKIKPFKVNGLLAGLLTVVLAVGLSALASLCPINYYVLMLGAIGLLKHQWQAVMPLLLVYVFVVIWPLWFVWSFISIKTLRPSLLKIICASVFFTASSCVIFIFK